MIRVLALALALAPADASAERAKAPADATVFIRLVGSLHAEIEEYGLKRTAEVDHVEIGTGSGFVISPFGYVLTNDHVVNQREQMVVNRGGQRAKITVRVSRIDVCFPRGGAAVGGLSSACAEASVLAADPAMDLAVLLVNATTLPYIALGDSDAVSAGAPVEALGYPFGREVEVGKLAAAPDLVPEISLSPGTVSALRADDAGERRYLQISNNLNPGNSGGPVLDAEGFAVGVIRMRLAKGSGIGFAIPVNEVKDFLDARGLSHLIPARRLRLGPFQRLEPKGLGLRLVDGASDTSPFRGRVEMDTRTEGVMLRIDRVLSPWEAREIEQALVETQAFEPVSLSATTSLAVPRSAGERRRAGHASGTAAPDGGEIKIEYVVLDLGAEKLVARYIGPAEQVAFNQSVLRESLASLEGQRTLAAGDGPGETVTWQRSTDAQAPWPLPAGWIVEPGRPAPCAGLPDSVANVSASAPHDFSVALRAASWTAADLAPEAAAAACSSRGAPLPGASYASRTHWLGVSFVIEGVFVRVGGHQLVQLEVLSPEEKSTEARALLFAWTKRMSNVE